MHLTFVLLAAAFVNSDAWNFWIHDDAVATGDRAALIKAVEADVDFYAQPGVEAVFYNMNFQRSFYPTKVGTPYWKDCAIGADGKLTLRGKPIPEVKGEESPEPTYRQMFLAAKNMQEKFPEFMSHRYAYCHRKGLEMWHSMRMNDIHHATIGMEFRPQHGDLWLDHKECIRAWYRHTWRSEWNDNALDYGQKKVYDYHLAMAREYLLDYPNDGFEFDWLRSAPVFKPGFDECNTEKLTEFVRTVKKYALEAERKWGHRIRLAHRVPARVRDAYGLGMDIATWAREGLVDVLIPGGVPGTATEGDSDVAIYRALAPKPVILAPEIDYSVATRPGWSVIYDHATDAGFASGFYQAGADAIYFYNHFPRHEKLHPWLRDIFREAADRAKVGALARRHVCTWHQRTGEGRFEEGNQPCAIWPLSCNGGVKINCGERVAGRAARVVFGTTKAFAADVLVNTVKCAAPAKAAPANVPHRKNAETFYYAAEIPAGTLHDGVNVVEFFNRSDFTLEPHQLIWLEVVVDAPAGIADHRAERPRVALIAEGCVGNGFVSARRTVTDAVAAAGFVPLVLPNAACTNGLDALVDRADALVLFGSVKGSMACRDDFEKRLVLRAAERGIPVVGFCRGHQLINKAFGGTIGRNPTNGTVRVVHHGKEDPYVKDCFHSVSVKPGTLTARGLGEGEQTVNSSHNYCIRRLADGFDVTAVASDGTVEAIEHRTLPVVGFQFHPERIVSKTGDEKCTRLIRLALENGRRGRENASGANHGQVEEKK